MTKDERDCIFCAIVKKKIPASIISETPTVMAFHDINKAAPLHALIIPKNHTPTVNELSMETPQVIADMMILATSVAKELGVENSGYRLVINTHRGAGQTVFHTHLHLLAGREFSWPPG